MDPFDLYTKAKPMRTLLIMGKLKGHPESLRKTIEFVGKQHVKWISVRRSGKTNARHYAVGLWMACCLRHFGLMFVVASSSVAPQLTLGQNNNQSTPSRSGANAVAHPSRFNRGTDCALCHSLSGSASAMRDSQKRNVAPYDLWSGTMMANSAIDPYWRAAVSAEVAATPLQKPHIEAVCSRCHAPMSAPVTTSPDGHVLTFLHDKNAKAELGKDGVSCTVCHQISAAGLGTEDSFTGGFVFNTKSQIFGPHSNPVTMPMLRRVGYTPTKGEHILSSAMCATCHTVITESVSQLGEVTQVHLHEQVPYLEWRNSIYNDELPSNQGTGKSCQSCHVPQTDIDGNKISAKLAHNPGGRDFPFLKPREPYGRHTFAGGNVFMAKLIRDNRTLLGLSTPKEAFDRVIDESRTMLQQRTAKIAFAGQKTEARTTILNIRIDNLSGHKFPTAYPSRRAWIELVARDQLGNVVFASGRVNPQGQLIDATGQVLASENAYGPIQPHFDLIANSTDVQIYETFMEDTKGELTFTLLRGAKFKKDNRLLPLGWSHQHVHAEATRSIGVDNDSDFKPGSDTTRFMLNLPSGHYVIEARLLFQSLSSRYVAELVETNTPEVKTFADLYATADRTPETIASATTQLQVP